MSVLNIQKFAQEFGLLRHTRFYPKVTNLSGNFECINLRIKSGIKYVKVKIFGISSSVETTIMRIFGFCVKIEMREKFVNLFPV